SVVRLTPATKPAAAPNIVPRFISFSMSVRGRVRSDLFPQQKRRRDEAGLTRSLTWRQKLPCPRNVELFVRALHSRKTGAAQVNYNRDRQLLKPTSLWLPSQNGLFFEWPQRQRKHPFTRATTRPVPAVISRLPRTR